MTHISAYMMYISAYNMHLCILIYAIWTFLSSAVHISSICLHMSAYTLHLRTEHIFLKITKQKRAYYMLIIYTS